MGIAYWFFFDAYHGCVSWIKPEAKKHKFFTLKML